MWDNKKNCFLLLYRKACRLFARQPKLNKLERETENFMEIERTSKKKMKNQTLIKKHEITIWAYKKLVSQKESLKLTKEMTLFQKNKA